MRYIQFDLFELSVIVIEESGREKLYYVELKDGFYYLYVQRKKGHKAKWSKPQLIEKSEHKLKIEFDPSSDVGLRSVIVA